MPVEITSAGRGERRVAGATVHRTRALSAVDVASRAGIRVTQPARTLLDLSSVIGPMQLEESLDAALREGLLSVGSLSRRLDQIGTKGRSGTERLRLLVEARRARKPNESRAESRLDRRLKNSGPPGLVRQYELRDVSGRVLARFDFAYPQALLALVFNAYRAGILRATDLARSGAH